MTFDLDRSTRILERTPAVLDALLRDLPVEWTHGNEGPETWSQYDVVGHLIHGERTDWMVRANIILSESADKRFSRSIDRRISRWTRPSRSRRGSPSSRRCAGRT